jgi:DNA-directed RNA polymerase subunit RPC12/RpoP
MAARVTLKAVNDELAKRGHHARLEKASGYFYFWTEDAADWIDRTVRVERISALTLDQWVAECGAVVGVIQIGILKDLLGLESAAQTRPHCGTLNTAPGFSQMKAYVCTNCGKAVEVQQELEWVEIEDDTCTWYEFSDGREPIHVMRCNRCGSHPDVGRRGRGLPAVPESVAAEIGRS